jgi:hypothetical protein
MIYSRHSADELQHYFSSPNCAKTRLQASAVSKNFPGLGLYLWSPAEEGVERGSDEGVEARGIGEGVRHLH